MKKTIANEHTLKIPKIVFTPKQKMREAANKVELNIDREGQGGSTTQPGGPGTGEAGGDDGEL